MFNLIDKVKEINPLVLHYTNNVTIYDSSLNGIKALRECNNIEISNSKLCCK